MRVASCLALALFACKREAAPETVSVPVKAPPPPAPVALPEKDYGDQYLVILSSSPTTGADVPAIAALEKKPELGAKIARLDSSRFKNLMPCYEIVVARAFATLPEARTWSKELTALGIDHYVKNAGKFVGRQPAIESYCEEKRSAPADDCGGLRFVEKWENKLFMALGEAAEPPKGFAPFQGNKSVWRAPLPEKIHGAYRVGDVMLVLEGEPMRCKIARFSVVTRGHPHFGYLQEEADAPGCGSAEVFAELDCPRMIGEEVALAIRHDQKPPQLFSFEGAPSDAVKAAATAALEKTSEFAEALQAAETEAKEKGAPLEKTIDVRIADGGERQIAVVNAMLFTGEGAIECGAEDVRVELFGAFDLKDDAVGSIALPFRRAEQRQLEMVLDLERDGTLETYDHQPPVQYSVRRADDSEACEVVIPFCDCGC